MRRMEQHRKIWLVAVGLVVLTLACYWKVQGFDFVNYDDPVYVTSNYYTQSGIGWKSLSGAFTDLRISNWHPLTMLSHALDWQLFGDKAGGHHWTNVVFHMLNTALLFFLLNRLTGAIWRSAMVAALFAVHPINVESVAWVAERKNVLSTFFWILTMLFYVWYVQKPGWKRYLPVLGCFTLGLMSKPMLVTLPFTLLLLDYWPLNRTPIDTRGAGEASKGLVVKKTRWRFLVLEKIPLFILTVFSIGLTIQAAKSFGTLSGIPYLQRLSNALLSYVFYLQKLFWPSDLAAFYPFAYVPVYQALLSALVLLLITVVCCNFYKERPYLAWGWFWYLGTLVPVIGIVQVGMQSAADRYAYVPFIGLFVALCWLAADLIKGRILIKKAAFVGAILIPAVLIFATQHQLDFWKNSWTLFSRALAVTQDNYIAHVGLGNELIKQEKVDEAILHFIRSININPNNPANYIAFVNLGNAWKVKNKTDAAIDAYQNALRINPKYDEAHFRLGFLYFQTGRVEEAIDEYRKAIALYDDTPLYHGSLGNAYITQGKIDEAIRSFQKVLSIQPHNLFACNNLGMLYLRQGKMDQALIHFQKAVDIQPQFANAHYRLSVIFRQKGMSEKAFYHYNEAVRINPAFGKVQ